MCSEEKYLQANYLAGMCIRAFQSYLTCMSLVLKNKTVHAAKINTHAKSKSRKGNNTQD